MAEIHQHGHMLEWESRTQEAAHKSVGSLVEELAELGFSWSDLAKMIGVTVPAVRKWRAGGNATGTSRRDLAALQAACALIGEKYQIEEVASWFEVPLSAWSPITPIDLYAAGHRSELFDYASGHVDAEQILSEFDPDWREKGRSTHEVFRSKDGDKAIRL